MNWYDGVPPTERYGEALAYDLLACAAAIGAPAGGVTFPITASAPLSAWRAVRVNTDTGLAEYAQPVTGSTVIGITTTAGTSPTVVRTGTYEDPSWSWVLGTAVILGADGVLTQTLPLDAQVIQPLGIAISATRLIVRLDPPTLTGL